MAITGTQSTASILASNAASNRLREEQSLLNSPQQVVPQEGVSLNASNPIGLISQGLSGAASALTAGQRRKAQQANLDTLNAARVHEQGKQDTLFDQQQEERRAKLSGEQAVLDASGAESTILSQANDAKLDLFNRPEFSNLPKGAAKIADDFNAYHASSAEGGGQPNALNRALALQPKEIRENAGAVENFKESVTESIDSVLNTKDFKNISPAVMDFAVYQALQDTQVSGGTVFDWFKGDINSSDLAKAIKKKLPDLIRAEGLATARSNIDNQANQAIGAVRINAARQAIPTF